MESFILSAQAILPIFLLMTLGYVLKRMHFAEKKVFDGINKLVFHICLPVLLFSNIYKSGSGEVFDLKLIVFMIVALLCVFVIGYFLVFLLTKENRRRGVMLQGFFRSNYAILGIPLVTYVCGEGAGGLSSVMAAVVVPLFNALAVISLERFRSGNVNYKEICKGIVTNPLILGCIVGMVFFAFDITLPKVLEQTVNDIAKLATPLALIALGANFAFSDIRGYGRELTAVVTARLVLVPLFGMTLAALLGFRGEAIACAMVVFGSPVAVSSFAMAQQMGGDEKLAAQVVVVSSALCLVTLFFWIFILHSLGLF